MLYIGYYLIFFTSTSQVIGWKDWGFLTTQVIGWEDRLSNDYDVLSGRLNPSCVSICLLIFGVFVLSLVLKISLVSEKIAKW